MIMPGKIRLMCTRVKIYFINATFMHYPYTVTEQLAFDGHVFFTYDFFLALSSSEEV